MAGGGVSAQMNGTWTNTIQRYKLSTAEVLHTCVFSPGWVGLDRHHRCLFHVWECRAPLQHKVRSPLS
eukprot:251315-Pyramimonas_sp.AAC.1